MDPSSEGEKIENLLVLLCRQQENLSQIHHVMARAALVIKFIKPCRKKTLPATTKKKKTIGLPKISITEKGN
jgi:hypothetical protein